MKYLKHTRRGVEKRDGWKPSLSKTFESFSQIDINEQWVSSKGFEITLCLKNQFIKLGYGIVKVTYRKELII